MTKKLVLALIVLVCVALPGCRRKKYENPIANDSSQPDKTLFDRAVNDLQGFGVVARPVKFTHPHAAKADRRNLGTVPAKPSRRYTHVTFQLIEGVGCSRRIVSRPSSFALC